MTLFSPFSTLVRLALCYALAATAVEARQRVLVYTRTATFRHDSIPTAVDQIVSWSNTTWPGFDVIHTEDEDTFDRDGWLDQFDALVFVSTSGRVLSRQGQQHMIDYIQRGGGYVGVHEASDCVYEPWYNRLVGAQFDYHPEQCHAEMLVQAAAASHPSVSWIRNGSWWVYDEMYNFNSDPRAYSKAVVLAANESTYRDPVSSREERAQQQGSPHPIAWYEEGQLLDSVSYHVGGNTQDRFASLPAEGGDGRMFYTALGHSNETWLESVGFQRHFLGGLGWVLNSSTIRSFSENYNGNNEAWRPGQLYEPRPAYVLDPYLVDPVESPSRNTSFSPYTPQQQNTNAAMATTTASVAIASLASLVSLLAMLALL